MIRPWVWLLALLLAPGAAAADAASAPGADAPPAEFGLLVGRVAHVSDGDTVLLMVDGTRYRIRLHEIDAPEHGQPGSDEARDALAGKIAGRYVRVTMEDVDDYGRIVGRIRLGDRNINREMVREGHAWAYRQYLEDRSLLDDEAAAREAGRGLWRQRDPVPPWRWRQGERAGAAPARTEPAEGPEGADGCVIKGNISRRGDRIYHQPGDRHYPQTRIDPEAGERWFCSAEEAERAGWRRAR